MMQSFKMCLGSIIALLLGAQIDYLRVEKEVPVGFCEEGLGDKLSVIKADMALALSHRTVAA